MTGDLRRQRHSYSPDELLAGMMPKQEHALEDGGVVEGEWLSTQRSGGWQKGLCRDNGEDAMPTILLTGGYRFFFFSLEGSEPPHVHIEKGGDLAKYWLSPVQLAESHGYRSHELNRIRALIIENRTTFLEAWHAHFSN